MAKENLTYDDCHRGAELVRELVSAGFPVGFAGWLRDSDDAGEPFRFYIATPLWDMDGPIETVSLIDRFFGIRGAALGFDIHDVEIGPSTADAMQTLRENIRLDIESFIDTKWPENAEVDLDDRLLGLQLVYVSQPVKGREVVKAARRTFEGNLATMEAA